MNPTQEAIALLKFFAPRFEAVGKARAAADCLRVASGLETQEFVRTAFVDSHQCSTPNCENPRAPRTGKRGRPPTHCHEHARTITAQIDRRGR